MRKKALIITYYWPPSGGSGVQRWLKFSKYLRDFGWEPVIYTPSNPEYPAEDTSFLKDIPKGIKVIKRPIMEPYSLYKIISGKKKSQKIQTGFLNESPTNSFKEKIFRWFRGNFFIPDARKFWIKPSIKYLSKWLKENPVDIIISTGPPHSMHLIALGLKKRMNLKWIADFRDPWTQIDFYKHLLLTTRSYKKHKRLEKTVLQTADSVITIGNSCADGLKLIAEKDIHVITNGYDEDDFSKMPGFKHVWFSITHLGSMNSDRNPLILWQALKELIENEPEVKSKLKIRFIGKTDYSIINDIKTHELQDFVVTHDYLPHNEAIEKAADSAILLLPLNNTHNIKGIITGKLFEYLALRRPVLCIGDKEGDAANIIKVANAGVAFNYNEKIELYQYLVDSYKSFANKSLSNSLNDIKKFSRRELARELAELLNKMITQKTI